MTALASGILLKLINEMNSGANATCGHRSSLLQVTDILPADLDNNSLFPEHGFYIKVSDSSHSIYASLPSDQQDFVLSNKVQLGQFIYVDRLEPGSPVPVLNGAKPVPGRHPLVRTTEPLLSREPASRRGSWVTGPIGGYDSKPVVPKAVPGSLEPVPGRHLLVGTTEPLLLREPASRRGSWATGSRGGYDSKPVVPKAVRSDFGVCDRPGSMRKIPVQVRPGCAVRASFGGGVLGKMVDSGKGELRKSCATALSVKFPMRESGSVEEDRVSIGSFNSGGQPAQFLGLDPDVQEGELMNLPGNLSTLGKEAGQCHETTRKMALRALREATTTETLVFSLGMLSRLIETARADAPATCFDRFLEFHQHIVRAMTDLESVQLTDKNIIRVPKLPEFTRKILKSSPTTKPSLDPIEENDENTKPASHHLSDTIELGKKIEAEASKWFMRFLETWLESGFKKSKGGEDGETKNKVSQSLILKVINWIEVEHCDKSSIKQHQRAGQISSKLRMKMKSLL